MIPDMQIALATESDRTAWDAYVEAHPHGLAYHRWAWKEAVEQAYGFEGLYLLAKRGSQVCGVLPTVHHKLPFTAGTLVSLPYCDVGGVLADDPEVAEELLAEALRWARRRGAKALELRNAVNDFRLPIPDSRLTIADSRFTTDDLRDEASPRKVRMLLDLPGSSEALLGGFKAKHRSQVLKPMRDGLKARLGGAEEVDAFYGVFAENMRDLGSPVHSRRWIQAVIEAFGDRARVGIVTLADGTPVAGGVILLNTKTVSIPWASSLRRFNRLNPNMMLYWTLLAWAADHGFARFDFGRSTRGEGTYRFKEQWGAKAAPLEWQVLDATGARANPAGTARISGRAAVEHLWQCLPVGLSILLGGVLRRYVSL